ncbi:demethylmenaquinone methyltransferase [Calidifontibacter sp. DB0510]|uniref:Demethylmenaquinone methyltransferase n=1 Tax=Metallococcus carri TaxID=1656884 RepID=A0A967B5Z3_9MICO|nr:demethylmenaquinone methyltransferase [Metallococcus carri]NHN55271.1 demethylmenaquinone methyltransferase [Metallococcus carri]NOP36348.1 demethylmenaquinone methyltransferase [Calidifontibacter sp. DB2511S]
MNRASLDKQPQDVARMFDDVAPRYDLTNDIMSFGQDRRWRTEVLRAVDPQPGQRVLDIAAGTGTSSLPFRAKGAHVVPADFSLGMLRQGKKQASGLPFVAADAMRLPFADDSFDAVTMSFGLRNVVDAQGALAEFLRVTKPGGRVVICEFSTPTQPLFRKIYSEYLMTALPKVAARTGSNAPSYVYLAESIAAWPDQAGLGAVLQDAGWSQVEWRNLTGGIVALHRGTKGVG